MSELPNPPASGGSLVEFHDSVEPYRLRVGMGLIAAFPENGYDPDQKSFAKHLQLGRVYEVERFEIDAWMTYVWLREIPGVVFNSVHFAETEG